MRTIAAIAAHPSFQAYRAALTNFATLNVTHETGVRSAFQNLLQALAVGEDMTLVPEQVVEGTRARPDGTLRDSYNLPRGYWEAKDTNDDLETEILKKKRKGYPFTNILFEDTQKGVLFQNQKRVFDADLRDTGQAATLLHTFLAWQEPDPTSFDNAQARFGEVIPDLARGLIDRIEKERAESPAFAAAFGKLFALCVETLNPQVQPGIVVEMLAQHLLTERLFRTIFDNSDFVQRNVIAHKVEETIQVMMSQSFNRSDFTKTLDKYYYPIESKAREATTWEQKQAFLNSLYERFFKDFSKKSADTQGIVYTPQPIVDFMLESVDSLLKSEFGTSLSHDGVVVLDPCVGTGNFMQNIVRRLKPMNLKRKYQTELFCNENMLLPYYIAGLNIEHAYYERAGAYEPFTGLCFTDTLLLENAFTTDSTGTLEYFDEENAERVQAQQEAKITVIIGNPPYNVGQKSENDNNKNRAYKVVDSRVASTYAKASKASNKNALSDPYVKFFRWATDRLQGSDGIVCFVSNNGFLTGIGADGMRKMLADEYTTIYHLDCGGNVRKNPKLSGTTHNVFGIQVGVGITILVRRQKGNSQPQVFYYALPAMARASEKLKALTSWGSFKCIDWQELKPDAKGNWLTEGMQTDFESFLPLGTKEGKAEKIDANVIFSMYGNGLKTNRDDVVFDFNKTLLARRIQKFIESYDAEVDRYIRAGRPKDADAFVNYDHIKWSEGLKGHLRRGSVATFDETKMRQSLFRPFSTQYLYFDSILNERRYQQQHFFPNSNNSEDNIVVCVARSWRRPPDILRVEPHRKSQMWY